MCHRLLDADLASWMTFDEAANPVRTFLATTLQTKRPQDGGRKVITPNLDSAGLLTQRAAGA